MLFALNAYIFQMIWQSLAIKVSWGGFFISLIDTICWDFHGYSENPPNFNLCMTETGEVWPWLGLGRVSKELFKWGDKSEISEKVSRQIGFDPLAKMSESQSPERRSSDTRTIPTRRVVVNDPAQLPQSYSTTPGGTLFSTTPGGRPVKIRMSHVIMLD